MSQWACWMNGKWMPYSGFDNDLLEEAYNEYQSSGNKVYSSSRFQFARGAMYDIDFEKMTQTNMASGKSRNIQRADPPAASGRRSRTPSPPPAPVATRANGANGADPANAGDDARMASPIMPDPQRQLSGTLGSHGGDPAAAAAAHEHDDDANEALPPPDEEDPGAPDPPPPARQYSYSGELAKAPYACCCCSIIVLLVVILVPLSFNYVPPNHVGIKIDSTTRRVSLDNYYPEGRYFMGPSVDFFLFPTLVQTLEDSITARAADGYPINIRYTVQYFLEPDKILDCYKKHNLKYPQVYKRISRERVLAAIGNYGSKGFYQDREEILNEMFGQVCEDLQPEFAKCWGMQFTEVNLAPQLEARLLRLELDRWYVRRKQAEQVVSQVTSYTEVVEADYAMRIKNVESGSNADANIIKLGAESGSTITARTAAADAAIITREAEKTATLTEKMAKIESDKISNKAENDARLIEFKAQADALKLKEEAKARATAITSTAQADALKTINLAVGAAKSREIAAQGNALQGMKNRMPISPHGLNRFEKSRTVAKYDEAKKLSLGFTQNILIRDLKEGHGGKRRLHEKREHLANADEPSVSCFQMTPGNSCGSKREWRSGLMGYKMLKPNATTGHFSSNRKRPGWGGSLHSYRHHHEDTEL